MERLEVDGATLNCQIRGDRGPWVTLVNGHTRTMSDFNGLTKHLVEAGFRVCTLDNRGAGLTQVSRNFDLGDMVEDLSELWRHFGIDSSHLLGISMGGVIAQHFAASRHAVERLILVSTSCEQKWVRLDEKPWGDTIESIRDKLLGYFSEEFYQRNKILVNAMCKQILANVIEGDFANQAQLQRDAVSSFDTVRILPRISCPTLVVHGDNDQIIDVGTVSSFEENLKNTRKKIFKGVGHLLLAECPKDLYSEVEEFIGG